MHRPRQRRRLIIFILATAVSVLACQPVGAGPPTDRLREFFADVNAVLADPTMEDRPLERVAQIRRLVSEVADMESAAATALGPDWGDRTTAERDEFIDLFSELLERAYVGRLAGAVRITGGITMRYEAESADASSAAVTAALRGLGGKDAQVEYRLTARDGRWRVRDIALDGVSVVENYRAQFRRLRQHDTYDAVVTAMRGKIAGESLMFAGSPRRPSTRTAAAPVAADLPASAREVTGGVWRPAAPAPVVRKSVAHAADVRVKTVAPPRSQDRVTMVAQVVARSAPPMPPLRTESTHAVAAATMPSSLIVGALALGVAAIGGAIRVRSR